MQETATLLIRVQSDQADAAKNKLRELGFAAKSAETATGGFMSSWRSMGAILAATGVLTAATAGLRKITGVQREFDILNASLKTATGSAEGAAQAFEAIKDFAVSTPYDIDQITESFIKLANYGLDPSERALRSYGNTAAALGKPLQQLVDAVANASAGNFQSLKSFGIRATTEADGIAFSFRGTTTVVENSAKSIEGYLRDLGENEFAGAMAARLGTLDDTILALDENWNNFIRDLSQAGVGEFLTGQIQRGVDMLAELSAQFNSGQLGGYIDALRMKLELMADGVYNAFHNISAVLEIAFEYWATDGKGAVDFITDAFLDMPENIRAVMQGIGATFGVLVEYGTAAGKGIYDVIAAYLNLLTETAVNVGKEIWSNLNPWADDFNFIGAQLETMDKFGKRSVSAWDATISGISGATEAWQEQITAILNERDASLAAFDAKIKGIGELRAKYDELAAARANSENDRLAEFAVGGGSASREFEMLVEKLRTEEQALSDSYAKRRALILSNTEADSDLQIELLNQLAERFGEEKKRLVDQLGFNVEFNPDQFEDSLALEKAALDDAYAQKQQKLKDALNAKLITEEEYVDRSLQLEQRHARESEQIERAKQQARLSLASDFFGNLATIANVFGAKGARAAKAFAIVQATIKTYESATSAYASLAGIPYVGPALGAVAAAAAIAAGMANVAAIKSQNYSGAYATGGMIPAGKWGIAQEAGPEIVHGPAIVTSARATADSQGANGGKPTVIVNIDAAPGVEVQQTGEREENGIKILQFVAKQTIKEVAADIRSGTGPIAQELNRLGMRRGVG